MPYSYRCGDYPGMEACLGSFTAETEAELWKHIELHAATAHQENPAQWSPEEREQIKTLIRRS
jgi:predicted small metal-binding protein